MSFFTEVLAHTSLFMFFLPAFFFFYVSPVQLSSLKSDLFDVIKSNVEDASLNSNSDSQSNFTMSLSSFSESASKNQQLIQFANSLESTNKNITIITISVFYSVATILLIASIIIHTRNGEHLSELMLSNLIVIIFIIISEFIIVSVFFSHFVEVSRTFLKGAIGSSINNKHCGGTGFVNGFLRSILPGFIVNLFT